MDILKAEIMKKRKQLEESNVLVNFYKQYTAFLKTFILFRLPN